MLRRLFLILSALAIGCFAGPALARPGEVRPVRVLFVCEHGYAKSMVAARLLERMAAERGARVAVVSRGLTPQSPVPPALVADMARDGFDVAGFKPQKLTTADLRRADRVIAFNVDLPAPKGLAVERWDVPALSEDYPAARQAIVARLQTLLDRVVHARR